MGACKFLRPPVQGGGSCELISKFLLFMTLYNHPLDFKSGEINSCELSPLPTRLITGINKYLFGASGLDLSLPHPVLTQCLNCSVNCILLVIL